MGAMPGYNNPGGVSLRIHIILNYLLGYISKGSIYQA